jgi:hypothetical protein
MASLRHLDPSSDRIPLLPAYALYKSGRRVHPFIRRSSFRRINPSPRRRFIRCDRRSRLLEPQRWKGSGKKETKEGFETIAEERLCRWISYYANDVGPTLPWSHEAQCALCYPWTFSADITEQRLFPGIRASAWSTANG